VKETSNSLFEKQTTVVKPLVKNCKQVKCLKHMLFEVNDAQQIGSSGIWAVKKHEVSEVSE